MGTSKICFSAAFLKLFLFNVELTFIYSQQDFSKFYLLVQYFQGRVKNVMTFFLFANCLQNSS